MSRRAFLRTSARAAAGLTSAGALLSACTRAAPERSTGGPGLAIGPAGNPVTLPIYDDNPTIASDLPVERDTTLRIFEWRQYLSKSVVLSFVERYREHGVDFELTNFENRDKAVSAIRAGAEFDVFFPTVEQLGPLVGSRLLQPLNHDHLPNVGNLWRLFRGPGHPYYDAGLRYSVPYTVFSTGIGWRSDLVAPGDTPPELEDPYAIYWNPRYRGKVGLYDDYREVIATAILHEGSRDVNTTDSLLLEQARNALSALRDRVDAVFDAEGAYEGLPKGEFAVHQAWSGDILSAIRFGHADELGTASKLRYFWPADGRGIVGADLMAIPAKSPNPVLAHRFLDHLLDPRVATANFAWNGYQPPLEGVALQGDSSARSLVPPNLRSAILKPKDLQRALVLMPLPLPAQELWLRQWQPFASGAGYAPVSASDQDPEGS